MLWCVLFMAWLAWIETQGVGPVAFRVGFILGITAVLLEVQAIIRWRRRRRLTVSA